ncbi:hypothetical protein [Haloplanus natans]|uniref:hypothetical protein n=1 Tax=Haloplanus natans TaxID=376171 RepID=UPI000677E4B7|nr:hypothetical protein [Haloplanus natans]
MSRILFAAFIYPILQFAAKTSELIAALFNIIIVPTTAFIDGLGQLILAITVGAADVIGAGSGAAAEAFLIGVWSALGPLAYPASIGAVLAGAYLVLQYLEIPVTADSVIGLFSGTDLPGPFGTDEDQQ